MNRSPYIALALSLSICRADIQIPSGTKISCRLEQSISSATAEEGQPVTLTITEDVKVDGAIVFEEGGSKAVSTGVITAGVAVLFWPAAPFVLLRKGTDITINKGIVLEVLTDQDHKIASAEAASAGVIALRSRQLLQRKSLPNGAAVTFCDDSRSIYVLLILQKETLDLS